MSVRRPSFVVVVFSFLFALPAFAQATRTWVSGVGDDGNPCSRTAPCQTLAGAVSKTAAGGEVDVLDPAGVGAVTLTKSITLDGLNRQGSVLASGTNGIVINAAATDVVILRGLSITAPHNGLDGIKVMSAKAVHVERCNVNGFAKGIESTGSAQLHVRDTVVTENGTAGLVLSAGQAVVEASQLSASVTGIDASGTAHVTLRETTVAGNATAGIHASGSAEVNVEHGVISANGTGVQSDSPAVTRLSEVMVSDNTQGLAGNVASFQNNRVAAGNASDGAPASTLSQQ